MAEKMITMIGIPLWPFMAAITMVYINLFRMFGRYGKDFKCALVHTLYSLVGSIGVFFMTYGLEVYFK